MSDRACENSAKTPGPSSMGEAAPKTVTGREVEMFAELDPATYVMRPDNIDLMDGESVAEWIARQRENGDTAYEMAKDLELFDGVSILIQVIERYSDGTTKCVDKGEYADD